MEDKKIAFDKLEKIKNEFGIDTIKDFIKAEAKKTQKKKGRPKSKKITGAEIYFKMFGLDINNVESYENFINAEKIMNITKSMEIVADEKGVQLNATGKSVTEFNKFAKELNYGTFCLMFDEYEESAKFDINRCSDKCDLEYFILIYSKEKKQPTNHPNEYEIIGDERYRGFDIKMAIAFYLYYKYQNFNNGYNEHTKQFKIWVDHEDIPF